MRPDWTFVKKFEEAVFKCHYVIGVRDIGIRSGMGRHYDIGVYNDETPLLLLGVKFTSRINGVHRLTNKEAHQVLNLQTSLFEFCITEDLVPFNFYLGEEDGIEWNGNIGPTIGLHRIVRVFGCPPGDHRTYGLQDVSGGVVDGWYSLDEVYERAIRIALGL